MLSKVLIAFAPFGLAIETDNVDNVGSSLATRLQGGTLEDVNYPEDVYYTEGSADEVEPGMQAPTLATDKVVGEVPDDHIVHDVKQGDLVNGDMLVGEKLQKLINGEQGRRRGVLSWDFLKWENGNVPYTFDENYPEAFKAKVREAMDELELVAHPERKCVRFREDKNAKHKVKVINDPDRSCFSQLGNDLIYGGFFKDWKLLDGEQPMNLHSRCFYRSNGSLGIVLHELMHSLGFIHEQSRMDRDEYVDIKWENIEDGKDDQFSKVPIVVDTHDQKYDYKSIMHYGAKDFSKNNKPTIVTKDREAQDKIGQLNGLSESDVYELRRAYDCPVISEQNCACKKTWSVNGVTVNNYCGRPTKKFGEAYYCQREKNCGSGTYQKCRPIDGLWKDGSICGLGTTCNWCYHKATYWYGKAFTACGPEPKWDNGTRCLLGTSCNACREKATYWYGKAFTACGPEPKWGDGTRCLAGTSCNACRNSYSWWWSKFGHHCGKEKCWAPGTVCGRGTTCESRCCNGRFEYRWYWFGFGKCKK